MGSCCCKEKSNERNVSDNCINDDIFPPAAALYLSRSTMISNYIMQVVEVMQNISLSFDDHPMPLQKLHRIADKAEGWQQVIEGLVTTVPLSEPMGFSSISIIFGDSPLPAVNTVLELIEKFELGSSRAETSTFSAKNQRNERNLLVVLGCMADKYAGTISAQLLTQNVIDYLFEFLAERHFAELVLQSLVTIKKFARTRENKLVIDAILVKQKDKNSLIRLERHYSDHLLWRQVRFYARWLLDNTFFVPGRSLTYTMIDMRDKNAILNCKDATDYLMISPDGLTARCDSLTFESARCTYKVTKGCWYYEAEILTLGTIQIGWASKDTTFATHGGSGVGDDKFSVGYDGCRRVLWHGGEPKFCRNIKPWVPGDILGCMIDFGKQEAIFAVNGVRLPSSKEIFRHTNEGVYAAGSFMGFQGAQFNFGADEFQYPPTDREYMTFNDHGRLSDEEKQIVPRWLLLERMQDGPDDDIDDETICFICYDRLANVQLMPCQHKGFCRQCSFRMSECPICRMVVEHHVVVPL